MYLPRLRRINDALKEISLSFGGFSIIGDLPLSGGKIRLKICIKTNYNDIIFLAVWLLKRKRLDKGMIYKKEKTL